MRFSGGQPPPVCDQSNYLCVNGLCDCPDHRCRVCGEAQESDDARQQHFLRDHYPAWKDDPA